MGAVKQVALEVRDGRGVLAGTLNIYLVGRINVNGTPPPLLDERFATRHHQELEPVQLLEGFEYGYVLSLESSYVGRVAIEPQELFSPDSDDWTVGRLKTGLYTGSVSIQVLVDGQEVGRTALEVRSRKLGYLDEYRWMLRDLTETLVDLVMERFSPVEQQFSLSEKLDTPSLYQRFAFLKSLISNDGFESAIYHILGSPHRTWVMETELRRPGQPVRLASEVLRQVQRPGPRVSIEGLPRGLVIQSVPALIPVQRTNETLDNAENRFVKHALLRWREFTEQVYRALIAESPNSPVRRGLHEVQVVLERLDEYLSRDLFTEVGHLTHIPSSSQVLQKRAGYREVYRVYLQFELAASLTWAGGEDVFAAGKRDVAALYEYWVFLQMAKILSRLCGSQVNYDRLFERKESGFGVSLRKGSWCCLAADLVRHGRKIAVNLYFNRTFSHRLDEKGSWTRPMRPDISVCLKPDGLYSERDDVWVHFDAKYRVDHIAMAFGEDPATTEGEDHLLSSEDAHGEMKSSKRSDLLKMHAYRDAIRSSAGAYVLYPGDKKEQLMRYHELLPGLGAFPLRPSETGDVHGADALLEFLDQVMTHVAGQSSQHERLRYWTRDVTKGASRDTPHTTAPFLPRPAADTLVLLGYARTKEQWDWIRKQKLYNLRADPGRNGAVGIDSRELAVEFVLLYGQRNGAFELWQVARNPELHSEGSMRKLKYPGPRGMYFCLPLTEVPHGPWLSHLSTHDYWDLTAVRGRAGGAPVVVTWQQLLTWPN